MLDISRKVTVMAGSFLVLVGILMIMDRPALMTYGLLFYLKLVLGLIIVGLGHVGHGKLKKIQAAASVGEVDTVSEKTWDIMSKLMPALALTTILLGVWLVHGPR